MSHHKKRAPLLIMALLMATILLLPNLLPSMAVFATASSIQKKDLEQNIKKNEFAVSSNNDGSKPDENLPSDTEVSVDEGGTQPGEENSEGTGDSEESTQPREENSEGTGDGEESTQPGEENNQSTGDGEESTQPGEENNQSTEDSEESTQPEEENNELSNGKEEDNQPLEEEMTIQNEISTGDQSTGGTDATRISLVDATGTTNPAYHGKEIIQLYNNIAISGNATNLDEGAYVVITLPKNAFAKPDGKQISTEFERFKNLEIKESDDGNYWEIIITYKTLDGGFSLGTPLKVNFIPDGVVNGTTHTLEQKFYDKNDVLLAENTLDIKAKAKIEAPAGTTYTGVRVKNEDVDENGVVNKDYYQSFSYSSLYSPPSGETDPRDRRIFATIPQGFTIKEGMGWSLDEDTGRYYKDLKVSELSTTNIAIEVNLKGMDLSSYDSTTNYLNVKVNFSIQPVEDGVVQTDLEPKTWSFTRRYYILKEEPPTPGAIHSISNSKYTKLIAENYAPVPPRGANQVWQESVYLTVDDDQLKDQRFKHSLRLIASVSVSNVKDTEDPRKMIITEAELDIPSYETAKEVRLAVMGADSSSLTEKLAGTKVYGVVGGVREFILEYSSAVAYSNYANAHTGTGWVAIPSQNAYTSLVFVFPNDGLVFESKADITKYAPMFYAEYVAEVKQSTLDTLKNRLDNNQEPVLSGGNSYGYTRGSLTYQVNSTDLEPTEVFFNYPKGPRDYSVDTYYLQYEKITNTNSVKATNGSAFYVNEAIMTELTYTHYRYGNAAPASQPENLHVYYLVPDGLEPVANDALFESITLIKGYTKYSGQDYNMVIAKPKALSIPSANPTALTETASNRFNLEFLVTGRLAIGNYTIYAATSLNNNKAKIVEGKQTGIFQVDTPSNLWANLMKDGANQPENPQRFTNHNATSFQVYPPKVLVSYKEVKLSTEPDGNYTSSIGNKGRIGAEINYRWKFINNSIQDISEITVIDILPYSGDTAIVSNSEGQYTSRGSTFKTPLRGPVISDTFDVFYSTEQPKGNIEGNVQVAWVNSVADYSQVTMIKAVLKPGKIIPEGGTVTLDTNNYIPNDSTIADGDVANNSFAYSLNQGKTFVEALLAEVRVHYDKKDILLEKVDYLDENLKLQGATFNLYEKFNNALIMENLVTNSAGQVLMPNLAMGKEYYLVEIAAPAGYKLSGKQIHFTVTEELIKVIAKNVEDLKTNIIVTKVWVNGPSSRPTIKIQLYRNGEAYQDAVSLANGQESYTWEELDVTDGEGKAYIYTVDEVEVPENYVKTLSDLIITNTYIPPVIDITATKVWVGGPKEKPNIQLQLYKNGVADGEPVVLANGESTYTWRNKEQTDANGNPITYTIDEVVIPDNYVKTVSGLIITNTYTPPVIDITATKVWVGGLSEKPNIQLQLYKNGVADGGPVTLKNGETVYTWKNKEQTDVTGNPIIYTVDEVITPDGYVKTVAGMVITNTYKEPDPTPAPTFTLPPVPTLPPTGPTANPTPTGSVPKAGDSTNIPLWLMIMGIMAVVATGGLLLVHKKRKQQN